MNSSRKVSHRKAATCLSINNFPVLVKAGWWPRGGKRRKMKDKSKSWQETIVK